MPTYARTEDGEVVERTVTEPGSLEDRRLSAAAADDASDWSVHYDTAEPTEDVAAAAPTSTDTDTTTPAPSGRAPRGPRASSSSASSSSAEGTDG